MRTIIKIEHIEERKDKKGKVYWRTHAVVDDGTAAIGYGKDFDLGMRVQVFHDPKYDQIKMIKS